MKKIILLLTIIVAALQSLSAQNDISYKKNWFNLNFYLAQHVGLNKWSNTNYGNEGLPPASVTELRAVFEIPMKPAFNLFGDMGLGFMPASKPFVFNHMPMPNSGAHYYLREMLSESGHDEVSFPFKMTVGWFGDFQTNGKLKIMPFLGVGGLIMARKNYEMILKEEGSNMQYYTTYSWGKNYDEYDNSKADMLGYLTGRLNFQYPVGSKLKLSLGLEYTHFFNTMNFYGRYSNTFNGNIHKEIVVEGNKMNMIGVSISVSKQLK